MVVLVSLSLLSPFASLNSDSFCDLSIVHSCISSSFFSVSVFTVSTSSSNLAFLRSREVCAAIRFFNFFLCNFSSHVKWSSRRFFPRVQPSADDLMSVATLSSCTSSCCLATTFLVSIFALSAKSDVTKFSLGAVEHTNSFAGIALGSPLGRVMMTLFKVLIIRHTTMQVSSLLFHFLMSSRASYDK